MGYIIYKVKTLPRLRRFRIVLSHPVQRLRYILRQSAKARLGSKFIVLIYPPGEACKDNELFEFVERIKWYLQVQEKKTVILGLVGKVRKDSDPIFPWLAQVNYQSFEVQHYDHLRDFRRKHKSVDAIMVWHKDFMAKATSIARWGETVLNLDKFDPASREYGVLSQFSWEHMWTEGSRQAELERSLEQLSWIRDDWRRSNPGAPALVVGTGPSYAAHKKLDTDNCLVIACNSVIFDQEFFDMHSPKFFAFGDAAHHVGPSRAAEEFRKGLIEKLDEFPDFHVVTTDIFAGVLKPYFARHWDRFLLFTQKGNRNPVSDVLREKRIPVLDSVLTNHMLPIASTFANRIFVIGADGARPKGNNDDFWPHYVNFQYLQSAKSIHSTHPTYDLHRSGSWNGLPPVAERYPEGLKSTFELAELIHKKKVISLTKSYVPPIQDRFMALPKNEKLKLVSVLETKETLASKGSLENKLGPLSNKL